MSEKQNVIVRIAGAAGDGIASTGELFGKTCSRMGLHVMAYNAFQSAIRGGHVWLQLNIGTEKTNCHGEEPDVALLFNKTSPAVHVPQMKSGGIVFYNASTIKKDDIEAIRDDVNYYGIDFKALTTEAGLTGVSPIMNNTMLAGALIQAVGLDTTIPLEFLRHRFEKKGEEVVELNQNIFNLGANWAKENVANFEITLKGDSKPRAFLTGNHALGMGFIAGGMKSYSAYPMSPATGILHYVATKAQSEKIVVKQVEDELAAINYAIGAAHAGVRAATATAGGGFCLMVEALGLAGMLEVPLVAVSVMRGGPSTGVPTKQEQADIALALGGNGEFPRIVIAPKDVEDAFYQAARALNLAEKYQVPVVILSDFFLSEHFETVENLDFSKVTIDRGELLTEWNTEKEGERYKRFKYTDSGISPRLIPGSAPGQMYTSCSDEHDERGEVMSDVHAGLPFAREERIKMHAKRMRKLDTMLENGDIELPTFDGEANADTTLLCWGSGYTYALEAMKLLKAEGHSVNVLSFNDIFPLDEAKVTEILNSCKRIVSLENNITNVLCKHLRAETGVHITETINRWDGEPFTGEFIVDEFKKLAGTKELAAV